MGSRACRNTGHPDLGIGLSVSVLAVVVLAALEFDYVDFPPSTLRLYSRLHLTAFNVRCSDVDIFSLADQQDLVELDLVAIGSVQLFDAKDGSFADAVLLATC